MSRRHRVLSRNAGAALAGLLLGVLAAWPTVSAAQDTPPTNAGDRRVFYPTDFTQFAPRTAYEMLQKVPGFVVRQAEEEQRGLGQVTSNVLLNGQRLAGKGSDVPSELGRVPAGSVVRIEIVSAASLNIAGLTGQVANVVAKASTVTGQYAWRPEFRTHVTHPLLTKFDVSVSGSLGRVEYTLALANASYRSGAGGPTRILGPDHRPIEFRDDRWRGSGERPRLNGRFIIDGPGSSVANLNFTWQGIFYDYRERGLWTGPGVADRDHRITTDRNDHSREIGGAYEFALGGGRLKLIALDRREHDPVLTDTFTAYADATPTAGSRYLSTGDISERIFRTEYRRMTPLGEGQLSLERTVNRLENVGSLFALDRAGGFTPLPLPNGVGTVEETRYEAVASLGRTVSPTLDLRLTAGGEYSNLFQVGGGGLSRRFWRPKGSLSAAWKATPDLRVNLKLQRQVGQLKFSDFLASVSLVDSQANAGNPNLKPPQSWEAEVEGIRSLGAFGATTLRLYAHRIDDIVDIIPIGETGESPGNIDRAWRYGVEWKSGFTLDPIGWRGVRLDMRLALQGSRLKDPLTGADRQISISLKHRAELNLRHDIPGSNWAWGGDVFYEKYSLNTRLTQVGRQWEGPVWVGLFIERKDVHGLTLRGTASNLLGGDSMWQRTVYNGRRVNPVAYYEQRDRPVGLIFSFLISGKF